MARPQDQTPRDREKSHPTTPTLSQPHIQGTGTNWRNKVGAGRGEASTIPWALTPDLPLQKFTVCMGGWGGCQSYHLDTAVA